MANINLTLEGYSDRVVDSMVNAGYAKTKTEALRLALYEFDRTHHLVPDEDTAFELVTRDILKRINRGEVKLKPFSLDELDTK